MNALQRIFSGSRVLVTGGAGFIGSHLAVALVAAGAEVRVLDNLSTGKRENLEHCIERIELLTLDLRDKVGVGKALEGVRFVFHQAALGSVPRSLEDPVTTIDVNVQGTANVLEAARRAEVERVVYASSSSVYGDSKDLPKKEGGEGSPLSPYALSKRMDEELAGVFAHCFGLAAVGLRYFNVYGPRQDPKGPYAAVIPRFFRACLSGESPTIFGDGEQSRDFTFVDDVVRANLLAAAAPHEACGKAYNIGGGRRTTILQLAREIARVTGAQAEVRHAPPRAGDVKHSLADLTQARQGIGYEPEEGLPSGLGKCLAYYRGLKT
ncbi:MAG TPA: SDR family oxidoreductase [Thermoanaerobaculia bacterium]|nr:SDR family oxidoreductase [Thermoanaerobaculia bacterium]